MRDSAVRKARGGIHEVVNLALYGCKVGGLGVDEMKKERRDAEGGWIG